MLMIWCFFQAEDGIRDIGVTGVQTCALPIWEGAPRGRRAGGTIETRGARSRDTIATRRRHTGPAHPGEGERPMTPDQIALRSEERRVGKEGRSRWTT